MAQFLSRHPQAKRIVVGGGPSGACALDNFLRDLVPFLYHDFVRERHHSRGIVRVLIARFWS